MGDETVYVLQDAPLEVADKPCTTQLLLKHLMNLNERIRQMKFKVKEAFKISPDTGFSLSMYVCDLVTEKHTLKHELWKCMEEDALVKTRESNQRVAVGMKPKPVISDAQLQGRCNLALTVQAG